MRVDSGDRTAANGHTLVITTDAGDEVAVVEVVATRNRVTIYADQRADGPRTAKARGTFASFQVELPSS